MQQLHSNPLIAVFRRSASPPHVKVAAASRHSGDKEHLSHPIRSLAGMRLISHQGRVQGPCSATENVEAAFDLKVWVGRP